MNAFFAATVVGWAWAAFHAASSPDRESPVLWGLLALHIVVATLLLTRTTARSTGSWLVWLACLPSLCTAGVAWQLAPSPGAWNLLPAAVFVGGGAVAISALLTLRRSFSVLPALRQVVSSGPYRVVRHPAYAGELVMVTACVIAAGDAAFACWFLPLTVALLVLRIVAEERHMATSPDYRAYASRVPRRLLPGAW